MNWRTPTAWTAVVLLVEPDHLLLRHFGGGAVLLLGAPVLDGQTPTQAAQAALRGPDSERVPLRPVLIDRRQQTRRQVSVHTFITKPLGPGTAALLEPTDGRSQSLLLPRRQALEQLPARARLRTQIALTMPEIRDTAFVEWRAWPHPEDPLGVPVGWSKL
jgi:hypothetical protein